MNFSNEVKVGLSVVVAALIFYLGFRYMQDIPLFRGSYVLNAQFSDAGGLVSGNQVRVSGVNVGSVDIVTLDPKARVARVRFRVDEDVQIPKGSTAEIAGVSALGGVRLAINLGPPSNPPIPPGGLVPTPPEKDMLSQLSDRLPLLAARADSLLSSATGTMEEAEVMLESPDSDFRTMLQSVQQGAAALNTMLRAEQQQLGRVMDNTAALTQELRTFTEENTDSLNVTVERVNTVLAQAERNLAALERTNATLDALLTKIEQGDGTLGRLVNDPGLYIRLDSAAVNMNVLLKDLQANPGRYLKDMTLVEVF